MTKADELIRRAKSWDVFATGQRARTFEQARTWLRTLGRRTAREWFAYCDGKMPDRPPRPSDIPKDVYRSYEKKGWQEITTASALCKISAALSGLGNFMDY
jgi:hypothetical protein